MLRLARHAVAASAQEVLSGWPAVASALSPEELARADALRSDRDRDAFLAAHVLVRVCAGELLGRRPEAVPLRQRCAECGGPHGRPEVDRRPDVHVSLAHSSGWVAAAADLRPCGIDIEHAGFERPLVLPVERALAPVERYWHDGQPDRPRAFLELWVRKEAVVKAGGGSLDGVRELVVAGPDGPSPRAGGYELCGRTTQDGAGGCIAVALARRASGLS
jgi:4'-phosphopantetheinyl transferase